MGRIECKVVDHVVEHGHQRVFGELDPRSARSLLKRFQEHVGHRKVLAHPLFGRDVREIEMEPREVAAVLVCVIVDPLKHRV